MLLNNKNAVIYGAGGTLGGAVARAFAGEGANVFLTGRTQEKLERVAEEITRAGGSANVAVVDALEQEAVEQQLAVMVQQAGSVDISFNAIWIHGNLQGTPLLEMSHENFTLPVLTAAKTNFITARAAARHMVKQRAGVILTLSSSASELSGRDRQYHLTGGFSTACATIEALTRSFAGELGPHGIRVVCLRPNAIPESWPADHVESRTYMEKGTVLGRLPKLDELAHAAVFVASDRASAMTGTTVNLSCGSIMD
jgi:NAD(P)-dependent dehydrogenase (short-subunit alcohol dehydrogenase family)